MANTQKQNHLRQEETSRHCDIPEHVDLDLIYKTLMDMKSTLDVHITEESIYKPKVVELVNILDQSKGILWFIKLLSVALVAGWGIIYWIRDHIKF